VLKSPKLSVCHRQYGYAVLCLRKESRVTTLKLEEKCFGKNCVGLVRSFLFLRVIFVLTELWVAALPLNKQLELSEDLVSSKGTKQDFLQSFFLCSYFSTFLIVPEIATGTQTVLYINGPDNSTS
jgi:hypothetical protein